MLRVKCCDVHNIRVLNLFNLCSLTESYVQGDSVIPLDLLKYRDVSSLTVQ